MKKSVKFIVVFCISLIAILLFFLTDSSIFSMSLSTTQVSKNNTSLNKNIVYKDIFEYEKNTITIDYNKMNALLNSLNEYIEYSDSLKNIYNTIIDNYYNSKSTKMYDSKNKKVLEFNLKYDEAAELFNKFFEVIGDTKVKILFDDYKNIEEIDIEKLNFKINRESIIRENIVKTAKAEVGKTGETYWNWYGFNRRVEWCCVFVSWVAYKNDVLNTHIPKFIWVKKGVDYYREKGQLKKPREYTPKPGDVVFFEWNGNTIIDHVGLVEKVKNGYVYTIEGNVNYLYVKEKKYKLNSPYLYAYGVPDYSK